MRRPLNGNGAPFHIAADGTSIEVFDTEDFGLDQTYALTLFYWSVSFAGSVAAMAVRVNNEAVPLNILNYTATDLDARRKNGNGPVKLLDRFVVRGKEEVLFGVATYGGIDKWLWGYFERMGESPVKQEFRPLQPTNQLVAPFNAPFFSQQDVAGGGPSLNTLHQLDSAELRTDMVNMSFFSSIVGGAQTDGEARVHVPGLATPIQLGVTDAVDLNPLEDFFDGIPIRPIGSTAPESQIALEIVPDSAADMLTSAYGRFTRQ